MCAQNPRILSEALKHGVFCGTLLQEWLNRNSDVDFCILTADTPKSENSPGGCGLAGAGQHPSYPLSRGREACQPLVGWVTHLWHTARSKGAMIWCNVSPCVRPALINSAKVYRLCAWVTRRQKGVLPSRTSLRSRRSCSRRTGSCGAARSKLYTTATKAKWRSMPAKSRS
jgi:hypothetical protein